MKNYLIWTGSLCLLFTSLLCQAQQTGTLIIKATHFEHTKGVAVVQLFREQDDIPENPFMKSTSAIVNRESTIALSNIPVCCAWQSKLKNRKQTLPVMVMK